MGKLLANTILQFIASIFFVVLIFKIISLYTSFLFNFGKTDAIVMHIFIFYLLFGFSWIATFVMGIVTLATEKPKNANGLSIASGILGILGGCFFAGGIVSLIGTIWASKD